MATAVQSPLEIRLPKDISDSVMSYVAEAGQSTTEEIARFVEEAVQMRLLDLNLQKIRSAFSDMSEQEIDELVQEAVTWARSPEGRQCE